MKRVGFVLLMLVIAFGTAMAQPVGDNTIYFVTYFSNANTGGAPDATLRLINDGGSSTAEVEGIPNGNLWASIYVFDDSQELQECCNCFVSPDGLLSESVNYELLANPLTGKVNTRGVIKVISSSTYDPTNNVLTPGLRGWQTHIQATQSTDGSKSKKQTGPYYVTEAPLADSNLAPVEQTALQDSCSFLFTLGSGHGICSCTPEDWDF